MRTKKQIKEKLENIKELTHYLACMTEQRNKANTCLQEIKEMLLKVDTVIIDKGAYYEYNTGQPLSFKLQQILDLINKSEVEND